MRVILYVLLSLLLFLAFADSQPTPPSSNNLPPISTTTVPQSSSPFEPEDSTSPPQPYGPENRPILAGRIFPFLSFFWIGRETAHEILRIVSTTANIGDLVLLSLIGWATIPFVEYPYQWFLESFSEEGGTSKKYKKSFRSGYVFQVLSHISQASKLAILVYLFDVVRIVFSGIGYPTDPSVSQTFAKIVYTLWTAQRLRIFKKYLLQNAYHRYIAFHDLAKLSVYNKTLDLVIYAVVVLFIMDLFSVYMGMTLSSLFALSGVGTLVFSLACKDLATQIVHGLSFIASNKFQEGDKILLSDGKVKGYAVRMGWFDVTVRGNDEILVSIPNNYIASQRIYNLSRVRRCQVVQTLRFRHSDAHLLPTILNEIKEEITRACPKLVTDGSRPFRCHLRDCKEDHLSVVLDCHFLGIPPTGTAYYDNRQKVLQAMMKVIRKHDVVLALPFYTGPF